MTREAAGPARPRRHGCAPAYAGSARPADRDAPRVRPRAPASPAPGAGSRTCAPAVRRPGRGGRPRRRRPSSPAATCPAPSSSSCSAASTSSARRRAELADRVLTASAPGRGLPDLGLVGVAAAVGLRLAAGRPVRPGRRTSWSGSPPRCWRRTSSRPASPTSRAGSGCSAGATGCSATPSSPRPIREALIADGRPPGGPSATVVVLGTSLDRMLVHEWTARSFGAGVRPWRGVPRRRAPARDAVAAGSTWPRSPSTGPAGSGRGRVHVVVDDARLAASLAGRRRAGPRPHRPVGRRGRAGPSYGARSSAPWSRPSSARG